MAAYNEERYLFSKYVIVTSWNNIIYRTYRLTRLTSQLIVWPVCVIHSFRIERYNAPIMHDTTKMMPNLLIYIVQTLNDNESSN